MKKKAPTKMPALLRCGLAVILACGLMLPTTGLSAYGNQKQEVTPVLEVSDLSADEATSANETTDTSEVEDTNSTDDTNSAEVVTDVTIDSEEVDQNPLSESTPPHADCDDEADKPVENFSPVPANATVSVAQSAKAVTSAQPAALSEEGDEGIAAQALPAGFTITGGVEGTDYSVSGSVISILTSKPMTLSGTLSGSVQINENVAAHLTLAGVAITANTVRYSPINLMTPSTLYLTLADGTTNTLTATGQQCAALHVGSGSQLYIDDARANWSGNTHIDVLNGVIDTAGTLNDGTVVAQGDPIRKLKSANPGILHAWGGQCSGAIGSGPSEMAGNMVFDGGVIYAYSWGGYSYNSGNGSAGTGIGGGSAGGATDMTFNAAEIHAYGSYHGAGIGAGWSSAGATSTKQIGASTAAIKTVCGNININGGYLTAEGYDHGNAFGAACGTTATGCTIRVTGGTLLPTSKGSKKDLGGTGGWVVVTGGSLRVASMAKFDGNAYNSDAHDVLLTMIQVDLKSEGLTSNDITDWRLLVDGKPQVYGAPSMLDDGKLYLWLPESYKGSDITVELSYIVVDPNTGEEKELKLEPLYIEDLNPGGSSTPTLKRYIDLSADKNGMSEEASATIRNYFASLDKYYDGLPLEEIDFSKNPISTEGIEAVGKLLNSNVGADGKSCVTTSFQTLDEEGNILEAGSTMPSETGTQAISIVSKQHVQDDGGSYWGHRLQGTAIISPVESKSSYAPYTVPASGDNPAVDITGPTWLQDQSENHNVASNNHLVVPIDVTSWKLPNGDTYPDGSDMSRPTSLAPYGKLQLFIDGRAVPERLGGVIEFSREDLEDTTQDNLFIKTDATDSNREHTIAIFNLTRSQLEAFRLAETEDGNHTVHVQYTSRRDGEIVDDAGEVAQADNDNLNVYRNYYDSQTEETVVEIQRTDCNFDVYNLKDSGYTPGSAKPTLSEDKLAANVYYDITKETPGTQIPFYVDTNSVGAVTITSSNPGVLTFNPSMVENRSDLFTDPSQEDFGFGTMATVRGAGRTTVTVTIAPTGSFNGATRTFDVFIYPDADAKPVITATETAVNLTRSDGTIRPGDTLRYTVTFTNTTANSAYQNPIFTITTPDDTRFISLSSTNPYGETKQLSEVNGDYKRQNAKSASTRAVQMLAGATGLATTSTKDMCTVDSLPTLFGSQSYQLSIDCVVDPTAIVKDINDLDFRSDSTANGVYGINLENNENYPWDDRIDNINGIPLDEVTAFADPTSVEPTIKDILGGDLINPTPKPPVTDPDDPDTPIDPDNPDTPVEPDPVKPGVEVGPVTPGTPFGEAEKADPSDPSKPLDPSEKDPINPGDRIIKFGEKDDPTTPDDIQDELDRIIKEAKEDNPNVTEVKIPVKIETDNPDDPDNPIIRDVIITVPVNPVTDPDIPDDHDLVIIPDDVDPREDGDITTTKSAQNVTPGYENRGNKNIAQVGDTIRYTIEVSNSHLGSAFYDVLIKDPLPEGLGYKPGTAVIVTADGTEYRNFEVDFDAETRTIGFCVGDLYGNQKATVTFDCTVLPEALGFDVAANKAYVYGTQPSTTIVNPNPTPDDPDNPVDPDNPDNPDNPDDPDNPSNPDDPDNPDNPDKPDNPKPNRPTGPVEIKRDPIPVGPYIPEDHDTTWEDIEKDNIDDIVDIFGGDPDNPPKLPETPEAPIEDIAPANPTPADLVTEKSAENLSEDRDPEDTNVYVGDIIRYTVKFTNQDDPWTTWYGVTIEDVLPEGLAPLAGSIKLVYPDGTEIACDDDVYSPEEGNMAVYIGDVVGGESVLLIFDVEVTEEAANSDIGNVAFAYGRNPSDVDNSIIDGTADGLPDRGHRYNPPEGWDEFRKNNSENRSSSNTAYPSGYDPAVNRVVGADDPSNPNFNGGNNGNNNGSTDANGSNNGDDTTNAALHALPKTGSDAELAQTGDTVMQFALPIMLLIVAAGAVIFIARRRVMK